MLFHSSIRKELARSFGATLVVLITVVMTMMLINSLRLASLGSVNPSEVMMVTGYVVLGRLPLILMLSLFIAIVSSLSRMYSESEMVIWFSSGQGLAGFAAPLLRFAWPVLAFIVVLALVVWPWSNRQIQDMKERFEKRGDIERVSPGLFQESAGGNRVFFIDKDSPDSRTGKNIFISETDHGKEKITSARRGRIDTVGGERFLMLSNGQRIENGANGTDLKVSDFEEYGSRIGEKVLDAAANAPARAALDTQVLLLNPTPQNLGELAWRMGLALAALNFVVVALAISVVNPRAGRGGNLLFALFSFVVYYDTINLGQSWIEAGKIGFASFMLAVHGGVLGLALLWLAKRHYQWSLRSLLARHRSAMTKAQA
jgi:lipopolysaccharide export system permease protein